jgi:hypothetical protein
MFILIFLGSKRWRSLSFYDVDHIMPLYVSSEFQNIFDVVTTGAAAHPQALLNDVLYNASLS